ncbi:MAG: hypothetical protein DRN81_03195 [Thermoproteota archaeon]|nr:MAG: hypothetical protein DRN81_03195 [Candidatus Korarchaeota archaeon]
MPPEDSDIADFVEYCRHFVSAEKNILFNDPVWDRYTEEEIIIEFFALRFDKEKEFREEYESQLMGGPSEEDYAWFDRMEAELQEKNKELMDETEEFSDDFTQK